MSESIIVEPPPPSNAVTIVHEDQTRPKFTEEGSTADVFEFWESVEEVLSKGKITTDQDTHKQKPHFVTKCHHSHASCEVFSSEIVSRR